MHLLAPYTVASWSTIPPSARATDDTWWADYGGYVAIGYNSAVVKTPPTSFKSLLNPIYKHMVGINNSPTEAGAAFAAVYAAALANGGSFGNIGPGISYFQKLNQEGNFVPVISGPSTVQSGATPIVIWWDYLQASEIKPEVPTWKVVIPSDGVYASYYDQAISANAPHPAAARLWEEYLYSTAGQNQWLQGYCRPIELSDNGEERHGQPNRLQGAASRARRLQGLPDQRPGDLGREPGSKGLVNKGHQLEPVAR